jgi:predicted GIY-YIG superfamily endonuclease
MSNYIVYLLVNTCNSNTYVGITNNKDRRLRQHNGELVGGAKYTCANKGEGRWVFYGYITCIPDAILEKNRALSIEKRIKIMSRKLSGNINPSEEYNIVIPNDAPTSLKKRLKAINKIIENYDDLIFQI